MAKHDLDLLTTSLFGASSARRVDLDPGDVLIEEGKGADTVYLLVCGSLEVSRQVGSERAVLAIIDEPGTLIGEMVALGGGTRTATVKALADSELVAASAEHFRSILEQNGDLTQQLVAVAVQRAEEAELVELLARHFGITDEDTLVATSDQVEWSRLSQGEALIAEGDESDAVYFVVRGRLVASTIDTTTGERIKVGEAGRGDVVGEMGLLGKKARTATLTAIRDTVVARMSEDTFMGLVERHPRLMIELTLKAAARAEDPRWHSAPSTVLALVGTPRVDVGNIAKHFEQELSGYGPVAVLSPEIVDAALDNPGVSESSRGEIGDVRVSRLVHEHELATDHLIVLAGSHPGPWNRRALGMADRVLVLTTPDITDEEAEMVDVLLGGCPQGLERSVVILHSTHSKPSGSRAIKERFAATTVVHAVESSDTEIGSIARIAVGRANALVLSGGGGRGFAHIGVFKALTELGHPIDIVGGTSMGGILATAIADRFTPDEIIEWAHEYFPKALDYTIPLVSLTKGSRIARSATATFGERDIEDLWLPFFSMATDLTSSRVHLLDSGPIVPAIRATSALPGVMPPVPYGDRLLVDGGLLNNLPMDLARQWSPAGHVVASDVAPPRGPGAHGDYGLSVSGWQALRSRLRSGRSPYPRMSSVLMRSMISASMLTRDTQVNQGLADCYIKLDIRGISMLDFDKASTAAERGYEAAMPILEDWLASRRAQDVAPEIDVGQRL